jgi:2',3'-cyclic-nucleotide 2'-phosphodiesterase/3'-nucleotidase
MAGVVEAEHVSTRAWVAEPVGALSGPLHSYFVWAGQDPASALINEAQIAYARPLLQAGAHAHLPLLSAVAPFRTGYTPQAFIDLAAGTVALRDVADLYPYPNTLVVVRATGEMLVEWLEWAARTFNTIDPAASGAQDLVDRRNPAYNFDAIAGLRYEIDVARPARYGRDGRVVAPDARRVGQVTWLGKPLDPAQEFAVVTNNYRADGGGPFPLLDGGATILRVPDTNREAVLRYLRGQEAVNAADLVTPWRLKPLARAAAVQFDTGARAAAHLPELPMLRAVDGAPTGYARLAFDL